MLLQAHVLLPQPAYALPCAELARRLDSDPIRGLTDAEARRRLALEGPNELPSTARPPAWTILAAQFNKILIVILLVAFGLSFALGHTV